MAPVAGDLRRPPFLALGCRRGHPPHQLAASSRVRHKWTPIALSDRLYSAHVRAFPKPPQHKLQRWRMTRIKSEAVESGNVEAEGRPMQRHQQLTAHRIGKRLRCLPLSESLLASPLGYVGYVVASVFPSTPHW